MCGPTRPGSYSDLPYFLMDRLGDNFPLTTFVLLMCDIGQNLSLNLRIIPEFKPTI